MPVLLALFVLLLGVPLIEIYVLIQVGRAIGAGATILLLILTALAGAWLLREQGLIGRKVAVELNGEIVPRSRHADTALAHGDRLEIVVAVGGG